MIIKNYLLSMSQSLTTFSLLHVSDRSYLNLLAHCMILYGAYKVSKLVVSSSITSISRCISMYSEPKLAEKYGPGSWVVVLDAHSRLGSALTSRFASQGFNILMISHNGAKMHQLKVDLQQSIADVEIKVFPIDLTMCKSSDDLQSLFDVMKSLDISLFLDTTQSDQLGKFHETYTRHLEEELRKNILSLTLLMQFMVRKMKKREGKFRSGIITTSCELTRESKQLASSVFFASKGYMKQLANSLALEQADHIDFLQVLFEYGDGGIEKYNNLILNSLGQSDVVDLRPSLSLAQSAQQSLPCNTVRS